MTPSQKQSLMLAQQEAVAAQEVMKQRKGLSRDGKWIWWGFVIIILMEVIKIILMVRNLMHDDMVKPVLDLLDKARNDNVNVKAPNWGFALSTRYPIFSRIWYLNKAFPSALLMTYQDPVLREKLMSTPAFYIRQLLEKSQQDSSSSSMSIVCDVFHGVQNETCFQPCPFEFNTTTTDKAMTGVTMATDGAFMGAAIGEVMTSGATQQSMMAKTGIVGGLLGTGIAIWHAVTQSNRDKERCSGARTRCSIVPEVCKA
jgi:hypothetical protein